MVNSGSDIAINAGVSGSWDEARLTSTVNAADLIGGMIWVSGTGQLNSSGDVAYRLVVMLL